MRGDKKYSILADHLGTPTSMYNEEGATTWERSLDSNGKAIKGNNDSCPFTFQGQYFDKEINLAYNRFRYYDADDGRYISKDPIELMSGEDNFYAYVSDTNEKIDVFGLQTYSANDKRSKKKNHLYEIFNETTGETYKFGIYSNELAFRKTGNLHSRKTH